MFRSFPLLALGAAALPLAAAAPAPAIYRAETVGGPVTPFSIDVDLRDLPLAPAWHPGDAIKEIPRRTYPRPEPVAPQAAAPGAEDPLIARQAGFTAEPGERLSAFGTPAANFAGAPYGSIGVPDTSGDVGRGRLIEAINRNADTPFYVYDTAGALLAGPVAMQSLAPSGACTTGGGDPIVLYDRFADRWFLQEFASSGNHLCIYISKTADPVTGGWWFYDFTTPVFPDYPHFGVWPAAYVATTNETDPTVYALDRANMLAGLTARPLQRFTVPSLSGYSFQTLTAADFEGPTAPPAGAYPVLVRHRDDEAHGGSSASDFLDLFELRTDWSVPANSQLATLPQITITDYNSKLLNYTTFSAVPQPGSSTKLDPIREVVMQKWIYRNFGTHESLVGNFVLNLNPSTQNNGAVSTGIRWFELRRTSSAAAWSLHQEGTWSNGQAMGTHNRWMGAVGVDSMGNIALAYNKTDTATGAAQTFPSLYYTGRLATDPAGVMTQGENLIIRGTAASGSSRWGDYASGGMDPTDDCRFWNFGEYTPASQWSTRISALRFDNCSCQLMGMTIGTLLLGKAGGNLTANWGPTNNALASYRVYRSPAANPAWSAVATGLTAANWNDAGQLGNPSSQYYSVTAANPCGAETAR